MAGMKVLGVAVAGMEVVEMEVAGMEVGGLEVVGRGANHLATRGAAVDLLCKAKLVV